jgi:hypothetical protein
MDLTTPCRRQAEGQPRRGGCSGSTGRCTDRPSDPEAILRCSPKQNLFVEREVDYDTGDEEVSSQPSPPRCAGEASWSETAKRPAAVFTISRS